MGIVSAVTARNDMSQDANPKAAPEEAPKRQRTHNEQEGGKSKPVGHKRATGHQSRQSTQPLPKTVKKKQGGSTASKKRTKKTIIKSVLLLINQMVLKMILVTFLPTKSQRTIN